MDRFIADAVKETILFNAEEGRESGLFTEAVWNNFLSKVIMCRRGGIVKGLFIRLEECSQITLC